MGNYKTKYFGEIIIDETSDFEYIDVEYKNQEVNLSLSDCNLYDKKLKKCLEIIDKYVEINDMAKKAILENFPADETVKYYFECHFDTLDAKQLTKIFGVEDFKKFDINKTVKQLKYPNLLFGINGGKLNLSVDYMISEEYSDEILCVKMDEELNITGFSHES